MAAPIVIAALVLDVMALSAFLIGHFHAWCCIGPQLLVFGPLLGALGATVSVAAAGLRNPFALLGIFATLSILLIGVSAFGWFGFGGGIYG